MIQPAFASASLESLQARAHAMHLGRHPYWLRLLHYRRNLLGLYQSEIDDASFFVSPRGRRDPEAELDATLEAFFKPSFPAVTGRESMDPPPAPVGDDDKNKQPAACRYPLRLAWLQEQLGFQPTDFPQPACPRYEKWREQMNTQSVALVFASSYMNNPSSMYGHTFLLLKNKSHSPQERLLDYVVNYAADLEADNGFLYALKGLMGGYHGRFSTFPYYMKVQEYNNLESRDLWEYDLSLSSGAVERLMQHLWELGNVRIRYFFLNKNCSYELMPLLEVVEPDERFKDRFIFRTIPTDTLRVVIQQPRLVGQVFRRPSQATKLLAERKKLSENEIELAEKLAHQPTEDSGLQTLAPERQALTLDAAYDLFRYHVGFAPEEPAEVGKKDQALLLARSRVGVASPALALSTATLVAPQEGHRTERLSLSYGFSNRSHFEEVSLRPSIHDQDDPPAGYLPGSRLAMFHLKLRYDNDRQTAYLQQFDVIDLLSITPYDRWIHPPSWKVNSGFGVANDLNRDPENSLYYGLNLGTGYASWAPGTEKALVYGMGEMELELGHPFDHFVRFGGGPSGGLLFMPCKHYRARFQASYFPYVVGGTPATTKLTLTQSLSVMKNVDLRVKLERQNQYKELLVSVAYFL